MLQQILRDLYVDPEILAELDEQQKQNLFCKMREEQVRRWRAWTEEIDREPSPSVDRHHRRRYKKTVKFLNGVDGKPWVWVMGEHENDKSIEDILREEAIEKARKMAEKEAEEIRKRVEAKITLELIQLTPKMENLKSELSIEGGDDGMDIYCSVDELRDKICTSRPLLMNSNYSICHYQCKNKFNSFTTERDVLQELSSLSKNKVAQRIALWEKKLTEERTCEIFKKMQKKQMEVVREAEEAEKKHEQLWLEQERKAKQAEKQIREIARKAREEHRLSTLKIDTSYCNVVPGVPPGRQAVLDWFKATKQQDSIGPWFHGLISRKEAETLLLMRPEGNFLVRLSEKIWGYAISYRASDRCKHYLVSATGDSYRFLGNNQIEHKSLDALIAHHRLFPLSGGEKLRDPCPRSVDNNLDELVN